MRVVLHETVSGLGHRGDVVDVSDGHARNFLIPTGKAQRANDGAVAQAAAMKKAWQVRNARERESAEEMAKVLVARTIEVKARAGSEGRLFGSVTSADIADAIKEQVGLDLNRRTIDLEEPIRSLGTHAVVVKAHTDVQFPVSVSVVAA